MGRSILLILHPFPRLVCLETLHSHGKCACIVLLLHVILLHHSLSREHPYCRFRLYRSLQCTAILRFSLTNRGCLARIGSSPLPPSTSDFNHLPLAVQSTHYTMPTVLRDTTWTIRLNAVRESKSSRVLFGILKRVDWTPTPSIFLAGFNHRHYT